jgi:G3E family GTPase
LRRRDRLGSIFFCALDVVERRILITPVTLLCGFLGSGKTTLLASALAQPALSNAVVIINEFGEISIDHLVVADLTENILELRNGCLCCTIRGDLAMTLRDLHRRRQLGEINAFDQVLVETSGLADPIPLAHTLMANPPVMTAYRLDAILCVVDAVNGAQTSIDHESAGNQIALADIVILSKTDIATKMQTEATINAIKAINRSAQISTVVAGNIDALELFGQRLFDPERRGEAIEQWMSIHSGHSHETAYRTHSIVIEGTLSLAGTSVFLNHVVNQHREQILRIKGIAGFREKGGAPALVHAVQDKFYPVTWLDKWPSDDHSSRLIFIGRDLDTQWLNAKFESLCI